MRRALCKRSLRGCQPAGQAIILLLCVFLALPAAGREQASSLSFVFSRSPAQEATLSALLARQQNPSSPDFRHWLTADEYAAQFGLPEAELTQTIQWLTAHGFTIDRVSPTRSRLFFKGPVDQIRTVSTSLPWVRHIRGLNDPRPTPRYNGTIASQPAHLITPADLAVQYDLNGVYDGSGVHLAVVGQTYYVPSDIAEFRALSGLPPINITDVQVPGTGDATAIGTGGDLQESELDLEWAGAVAPNANISFVYVGGAVSHTYDGIQEASVFDALDYAVENEVADIISVSYGLCESSAGEVLGDVEQTLDEAAAMGITVVVASGDYGSQCALDMPGVDFPASSPDVTAVGATTLDDSTGTWWSATNGTDGESLLGVVPEDGWSNSGGGASGAFDKPIWQYISGVPNDGVRDVPDVALNGSWSHDGYVACVNHGCDGDAFGEPAPPQVEWGGTSIATPVFAGMIALVAQALKVKLGNVAPVLYSMAANGSSAFRDITSGSNGQYTAGVGYDQVTGLGSVDALQLLDQVPVPTSTHLTFSASTLTATVSGFPAPTPLEGTVQFFFGNELLASVPLGVAMPGSEGTVATASLSMVTDVEGIQAKYLGSGNYQPSQSQVLTEATPPLVISPNYSTVVFPILRVVFQATGGTPPYRWIISDNESGATIDALGAYAAGRKVGAHDTVLVVDSLGNVATAHVTVGRERGDDIPSICGCRHDAPDIAALLLGLLLLIRRKSYARSGRIEA